MTPRPARLLDMDFEASEPELYCYSNLIKKDENGTGSDKNKKDKSNKNAFHLEPQRRIEEDKYQTQSLKSPPQSLKSYKSEVSFGKYNKEGSEANKIKRNRPKLKIQSSNSSSEFFINWTPSSSARSEQVRPQFWVKWRAWKWASSRHEQKKLEDSSLNANQKQIYTLALRRATDENRELLERISGLQQQIHELKIENSTKDQTIDELAAYINKLTDGELDKQLHEEDD